MPNRSDLNESSAKLISVPMPRRASFPMSNCSTEISKTEKVRYASTPKTDTGAVQRSLEICFW
eukprot:7893822-Pyramimonas_sp.AAC.1